ncbi:MAG: FecR family protein [Treponema sp.]|jgi:hypothetical protein|nr:FecR family protein [Treponema sp.]
MMKKLVITGMAFVLGAFMLYAQQGAANDAYIREFNGTVEIKAPGVPEWKTAEAGVRISRDTIISTGFKSTALIVLGNSTLTVRPLTRLSLAEIQSSRENESVSLDLHTGRIRAEVNPPPGGKVDFTIRSPSATASVRGTKFDFNEGNLSVTEGQVHITGGDGSGRYVGAGQRTASDPRTGSTSGARETFKSQLAPTLPAAAAAGAPVAPAAAAGLTVTASAPGTGGTLNPPQAPADDGMGDLGLVISF